MLNMQHFADKIWTISKNKDKQLVITQRSMTGDIIAWAYSKRVNLERSKGRDRRWLKSEVQTHCKVYRKQLYLRSCPVISARPKTTARKTSATAERLNFRVIRANMVKKAEIKNKMEMYGG